mmetsp:Transcript_36224/g.65755  ORF Transcript_36224/g.65755 Transcript_36224/m.65755 type:complete len:557 (+) Transcript_36224:76-1746(+)
MGAAHLTPLNCNVPADADEDPTEAKLDVLGAAAPFSPRASSPSRSPRPDQDFLAEHRIRFFNYNMANNPNFTSVNELQGPGGRGSFLDALRSPFSDGQVANLSFVTLVETRLSMTEWVMKYLSQHRQTKLDSLLLQNARAEAGVHTRSRVRSFVEGLAANYAGNLKSLLAFSSAEFEEDSAGDLFGRLTEREIAGLPVPNPKKAFMGRSLVAHLGEGPRFCFVGAHFPVAKLAACLEDPSCDPLHGAKTALAKTLRRVLKKASKRGLTDEHTIIFVQGDLNSRTVLVGDEAHDALLELLEDDSMQAAMQHQLGLPPGRWREVESHSRVEDLPVTYKFHLDQKCKSDAASGKQLTIGDVIGAARTRSGSAGQNADTAAVAESPSAQGNLQSKLDDMSNIYKRTLDNLGHEQRTRCALAFKPNAFRPFRFPACADRVIYWAADSLADKLSWELPQGGYEVNHAQLGSDHRPVTLEVILRVSPKPLRHSKRIPIAKSTTLEGMLTDAEDVSDDEADGKDLREGRTLPLSPSPKAFGADEALSLTRYNSEPNFPVWSDKE